MSDNSFDPPLFFIFRAIVKYVKYVVLEHNSIKNLPDVEHLEDMKKLYLLSWSGASLLSWSGASLRLEANEEDRKILDNSFIFNEEANKIIKDRTKVKEAVSILETYFKKYNIEIFPLKGASDEEIIESDYCSGINMIGRFDTILDKIIIAKKENDFSIIEKINKDYEEKEKVRNTPRGNPNEY